LTKTETPVLSAIEFDIRTDGIWERPSEQQALRPLVPELTWTHDEHFIAKTTRNPGSAEHPFKMKISANLRNGGGQWEVSGKKKGNWGRNTQPYCSKV